MQQTIKQGRQVATKAQFFRYLKNGGAVRMIEYRGESVGSAHRLGGIRKAAIVQANAVMFEGGSWLYKDDVMASDVHPVSAGGTCPAVSVGWATYQLEGGAK